MQRVCRDTLHDVYLLTVVCMLCNNVLHLGEGRFCNLLTRVQSRAPAGAEGARERHDTLSTYYW